ncbi:MAG: hypothetical protein DMD30_04630 [Gemmatimonadetes bacterium]|nr:MAG: hypothetical protein DMD30_04630 [Gemmatimonadota bacterium]PYP54540.1 MAG: hypothetical protein DMD39_00850 [Gemmatimonadota bacterium]
MGGSFGFGCSFGGSFLGGGGSSFFIATKLTFSARFFSGFRVPARAVAKTARKMTRTCNITLKMVPPTDRFFLSVF